MKIDQIVKTFDAACNPDKVFVCNMYCDKKGVVRVNYDPQYDRRYGNDPYHHREKEFFYRPYSEEDRLPHYLGSTVIFYVNAYINEE